MQVVAMALVAVSFYLLGVLSLAIAFVSRWWPYLVYVNAAVLFVMLYLQVASIPLNLNWSRNLYGHLLANQFIYICLTGIVYAIHYHYSGILKGNEPVSSFSDSVYFSFTTWTTLGYGDITVQPHMRLATSLEAVTGIMTAAVLTSLIWLYCQERLHAASMDFEPGVVIRQDRTLGGYKEVESEATKKDRDLRRKKFSLNPCKVCKLVPELEKYYDITGRLVALANFVAVCECGRFEKPSKNAYLAAYRWNRKNRLTRRCS